MHVNDEGRRKTRIGHLGQIELLVSAQEADVDKVGPWSYLAGVSYSIPFRTNHLSSVGSTVCSNHCVSAYFAYFVIFTNHTRELQLFVVDYAIHVPQKY
jgi:hypothetical protein